METGERALLEEVSEIAQGLIDESKIALENLCFMPEMLPADELAFYHYPEAEGHRSVLVNLKARR